MELRERVRFLCVVCFFSGAHHKKVQKFHWHERSTKTLTHTHTQRLLLLLLLLLFQFKYFSFIHQHSVIATHIGNGKMCVVCALLGLLLDIESVFSLLSAILSLSLSVCFSQRGKEWTCHCLCVFVCKHAADLAVNSHYNSYSMMTIMTVA
jgi:hypothetical protein